MPSCNASVGEPAERLTFDLAFRPPYDWEAMLAFLEKRAVTGVEAVEGRNYLRTIQVERQGKRFVGWLSATPSSRRSALRITLSASLAGALPMVLSRVKHLFDLACRPDEIAAALGPLAATHPGLRLPGAVDGFEIAVRGILGQQVTVKAATRIAGRLVAAFGEPIETPHARLQMLFPRAGAIAALAPEEIAAQGVIATRAGSIVALAREVAAGRLRLEPSADIGATVAALDALPGVGPWTAEYIAMRALAWPDAFPHPDVAVLKAMKRSKPAQALALAESWRPWRAYAVLHLWKSLEKHT